MTAWQRVLAFCGAWAGFGIVSGWLVMHLPARWLDRDRSILVLRGFEQRGRWYEHHLHIQRWKDRIPDAGALFGTDVSKTHLAAPGRAGLVVLERETRRAEWVHWANIAFGVTFWFWNPWTVGVAMIVFALAAHLPFVAVQRYNRARIRHVLARGRAHEEVEPPRPRHRVRRALALSLVAGFVAFLVLRPSPPRPVTLDEARAALSSRRAATSSPDAGHLVPAEGVYRYRGSGHERLSRPPVDQPQGPDMPGTVTHTGDGCWRFRIYYSTKHHQSWDFCAQGSTLVERGGESRQLLDLVVTDIEVASTTTCDDGTVVVDEAAEPGRTERQVCRATATGATTPVVSSGPATYVGDETVQVGSTAVATHHVRHTRTFSGGQDGTEALDWWLDAATGLPVRCERHVVVRTDSPLGRLTYTEDGDFTLVDEQPER